MWVWVLLGELGELGEREGERDRERAVAPSTAPRDGAVKTRALRRGGGGSGGGGDGGSGTSSPLRSKTCLPVSSSRCCGCLRRCLSSCLSRCRCRSRFEVGQNGIIGMGTARLRLGTKMGERIGTLALQDLVLQ